MDRDDSSTYLNLEPGKDARALYQEALGKVLDGGLTGQVVYELNVKGGGKEFFYGTETDLDENAYGAAAVAIIRCTSKLDRQMTDKVPMKALALTYARLFFSLGIMLVNLVSQSAVLWYIYIFVVQPSVRHVQVLYAEFHALNFDVHGNLDREMWADYVDKQEVCEVTLSSRTFYFGILALWMLLMMMELRSCQRVAQDIWTIRRVETLAEVLDFPSTDNYELGGRCLVVGLTPATRMAVMMFVCIPRFILGVLLFVLGLQWLSSSASFSDMTLNAMALEFVKNIDELLYHSVLPRELKDSIADTNLYRIEPQKTLRDVNKGEWTAYKRTAVWITVMGASLWIYGAFLQTVLPFDLSELHSLCAEELAQSQTPLCTRSTIFGWSKECYPYGHVLFR